MDEMNDYLMAEFTLSSKLHWEQINEGYTNENYTIMKSNGSPLAVCKIFTDDEIYLSKERFKREISALEKYSETIAPKILFQKNSKIIVYQYVEGTGLHQLPPELIDVDQVKKTLDILHSFSVSRRKPTKSDVTSFYIKIAKRYQKSKLAYPHKLIDSLLKLINQQEELLDTYTEFLSYVHGDLIPPNLIYKNNKITLIDWEFSRTELIFFDYQYLNYYAKAHNLPIKIEMEDELQLFYNKLIDVLERLWRYGYLLKNKKIDYSI
jgi:thiamine kinase-like enzyme